MKLSPSPSHECCDVCALTCTCRACTDTSLLCDGLSVEDMMEDAIVPAISKQTSTIPKRQWVELESRLLEVSKDFSSKMAQGPNYLLVGSAICSRLTANKVEEIVQQIDYIECDSLPWNHIPCLLLSHLATS